MSNLSLHDHGFNPRSKQSFFDNRLIVSQEPGALNNPKVIERYLPILLSLTSAIEAYTGYRWRVTSYIRGSRSHKKGFALDIAPEISSDSMAYYAAFNRSDPVLYKRAPLIRQLQQLAAQVACHPYTLGIFIEPDHLHLQVVASHKHPGRIRVVKWKIPKDVYPDSRERMRLPVTCCGYPTNQTVNSSS